MKTWKPDTCECEVEEIYSGTTIIGGGKVLKKCLAHTIVPDTDLYGVLYSNPDGENKRKNQIHRALLGYDGDIGGLNLSEPKTNPDGSDGGLGLKTGIEYLWSFIGTGKDRVIRVELKGITLSPPQKTALRNFCNSKFGTGKVEIL